MTKKYSTDYFNTLIEVSEDCPTDRALIPPAEGDRKTIAAMQYETLINRPYAFRSDDVLFGVHCMKNQISEAAADTARVEFFAKPQACLRASPLPKRYGFGIHFDADGKIALVPVESEAYRALAADPNLKHVKAMRTSAKRK